MAALQRALSFAQVDDVALLIGQHLHLNVTRVDDRFLDINFAIAKRPLRLAARAFERRLEVVGGVDKTHAFATTACGGFQHDRITDARGHFLCLLEGLEASRCAGHKRNACAFHGLAGAGLRSHSVHGGGRGADEFHPRLDARSGELRILGEKSVSRMDRVCSGSRGDVQKFLNIEIGLGGGGRADGIGLVGFADVEGGAIYLRVDGNGGDSHFVAGTNDPHGDLAAIRDENFLEHFLERDCRSANSRFYRRFPAQTPLPRTVPRKAVACRHGGFHEEQTHHRGHRQHRGCGLGGYVSVNYCFRRKVRCHEVVVYFQEPTKIRESKSLT